MRLFLSGAFIFLATSVMAQSLPFGNVATQWQCEAIHQRQFPNQPGFSSYMNFTMVLYPNGQAEALGKIQIAAGTGPFQSVATWQYDGQAVIVQGPMSGGGAGVTGLSPQYQKFIFIAVPQSANYMSLEGSQQAQNGGVIRNANHCQRLG